MSQKFCQQCGNALVPEANFCTKCGTPLGQAAKQKKSLVKIILITLAVLLSIPFLLALGREVAWQMSQNQSNQTTTAACTIREIEVKIVSNEFKNDCVQSDCSILKGAATINNRCTTPIGVQIKVVGLDAANNPIASRNFWPERTRNLPPGQTVISLDQALDYDSRIERLTIQPIAVQEWSR